MHTKTEEKIVYTIGIIGVIAILFYNLKSGVSLDTILLILKDLAPLLVNIVIFYIVEGMKNPAKSFKKPAEKAITKIRQQYKDYLSDSLTKTDNQNGEKCLFLVKPKTAFIPIDLLANGSLEIRISYGTLANFDYSIFPNDPDKETKIANVAKIVKSKTIETLQKEGARFEPLENNGTLKVKFVTNERFERIIEKVVGDIILLLKEKQGI
ncbi:hypothetical protein EZS27_021875 [termite gut metagenome]|uniref:Uncharacterized protein n=1 Tax=termite gut metagenome TaxID=433724 RepID=A0A5J4R5L3_9ZZZZ